MKHLSIFALLTLGAAPVDQSRSYLLSIGRIPLKATESIKAFSIATWGVEFRAVGSIPSGWRIKAGGSAAPSGELDGKGSQGATWFRSSSPKELRNFVLVTLVVPAQRVDVGRPGNGIPATFKGTATISTESGEVSRALSYRNITLTLASRCPHK